jgi:hypothetical protein
MAAAPQLIGPRCDRCETMLVHVGAMCIACDEDHLFVAPHLTTPPLRTFSPTNHFGSTRHGASDLTRRVHEQREDAAAERSNMHAG